MKTATHEYRISGVLRTARPMSITPPLRSTYKEDGKFQVSVTSTATVILDKDCKLKSDDNTEEKDRHLIQKVPIAPATTLRGMLRRAAASYLVDHLTSSENEEDRLPEKLLHGLTCGATSYKPTPGEVTINYATQYREHFFFGLFGGGPMMMSSPLVSHDAFPVVTPLLDHTEIFAPTVREELRNHALMLDPFRLKKSLTELAPIFRRDDIIFLAQADPEKLASIVQDPQGYLEHIAKVTADNRSSRQAAKKAKAAPKGSHDNADDTETADGDDAQPTTPKAEEKQIRAISGYERVVIGVPYWFDFSFVGTEAQLGMLLLALERGFGRGIGGKKAKGHGRFSGVLNLHTDGEAHGMPAIQMSAAGAALCEGVKDITDATLELIKNTSIADVALFLDPSAKEKPKTKKEKAKK